MKHKKGSAVPGREQSVVLVLGMHRSGTSALTRVMNLLGIPLGDDLLQPQDDNSNGFWEHTAAVEIHEKLLAALGRNWHDVREMPEGWLEHSATETAISEIVALVSREMRGQSLWAVKDPRMCRLLPVWVAALDRLKIRARAVIAVRDPREVALSLHKRDGWTLGHAYLMWIQHFMEALTASSSISRAVVGYTQLLQDWRQVMGQAAASLGLAWPNAFTDVGQEIDGFLNPQDQHQRADDPGVSPLLADAPLPSLLETTYQRALEVAMRTSDWSVLEPCAEAYSTAVAVFSLPVRDLVAERNELERVALERMQNIEGLLTAKELVEQRERELHAIAEAAAATNTELERVALERLNNIEGLVVAKELVEQRERELQGGLDAHVAQLEWLRTEAQGHIEARKQAQVKLDEQAQELERLSLDRRELDTLRDALERERLFVERAFEVSDKLEAELREKLAARDAQIIQLLEEQTKASADRASVIGASAVVERARQEAEDARAEAEARIVELGIQLQARDVELSEAGLELESRNEKVRTLTNERTGLEEALALTRKELEDARIQHEVLKGDVRSAAQALLAEQQSAALASRHSQESVSEALDALAEAKSRADAAEARLAHLHERLSSPRWLAGEAWRKMIGKKQGNGEKL